MATEQQTKWNSKIQILTLLAAIWAMLASTAGARTNVAYRRTARMVSYVEKQPGFLDSH